MGCPCQNKNNAQIRDGRHVEMTADHKDVPPAVNNPASPLACRDCLDKHLGAAVEYAKEAEEDKTRVEEYRRALGHMVCAEDHARALGLVGLAGRIRMARKTFQKSRAASDMESVLKWDDGGWESNAGSGAKGRGVVGVAVTSGAPGPASSSGGSSASRDGGANQ